LFLRISERDSVLEDEHTGTPPNHLFLRILEQLKVVLHFRKLPQEWRPELHLSLAKAVVTSLSAGPTSTDQDPLNLLHSGWHMGPGPHDSQHAFEWTNSEDPDATLTPMILEMLDQRIFFSDERYFITQFLKQDSDNSNIPQNIRASKNTCCCYTPTETNPSEHHLFKLHPTSELQSFVSAPTETSLDHNFSRL
jgi:hypothetical protein